MKSFIKLAVAVIAVLAVIFTGANIILHNENKGDAGRPYRVEAERIAARIENREPYSLNDYSYIKNVEIQENGFQGGDSDYLVKEIGGKLYRFDYSYQADNTSAITSFNICFGVTAAFVLLLLLFLFIRIIRPFEKISAYPTELAKGNLTAPLKDSKSKYFGKFLWGLDLLREKLESQRSAELALQKQNKTMVLSLSHDIKTPLGVIELYAKALEKGLYKDEQKKKEVAVGITEKCEDIRGYVDGIVKASSEDFLNLEVNNGEFYLSALIDKIKAFYTDKLSLLKIDFAVDAFSDHILSGDLERSIEVLQNIIENAVKYGDGKRIRIAFSREDDCQLIHIRNSGCTLCKNELPHIFDSFWRGSNTGSNSGSGLGLYICRTLMRKMNGDIFAEIQDEEMVVTTVFEISY
ncbi:MAG: HAMP domain-containing sensor histidine kinase [Ruminococcus sp.]|nr:HAMP domain-containing sensor histidine kinase [Ruminococcus sp.]